MEHFFELPVNYKGEELVFKGRLVTFGYTYKFYIVVNGREVVIERDDEQNYRILAGEGDIERSFDPELAKAIIDVLKAL